MTVDDISTCHCFIRHAVTKDDREAVARRLEYAREIGDSNGIIIALAQLTGDCPARRAAQEESA